MTTKSRLTALALAAATFAFLAGGSASANVGPQTGTQVAKAADSVSPIVLAARASAEHMRKMRHQ
jgi:hypothetical protein